MIADKQPVGAQFALLQDVFGAPAELFLALRANCANSQDARRTRPVDPTFAQRMRLYGELPLGDMLRRGWLNPHAVHDADDVLTSLLTLFDVDCAERIDDVLQALACDDDSRRRFFMPPGSCVCATSAMAKRLSGTYTPQRLRRGSSNCVRRCGGVTTSGTCRLICRPAACIWPSSNP